MLPRLYAILDAATLARLGLDLCDTALTLTDAGVTILQYREKSADRAGILRNAQVLARRLSGSGCTLILNDYPDLVEPCGFSGVHLGQSDVPALDARASIGDERILGLSTHNEAQLLAAQSGPADYLAIGPVFATSSKQDAELEVGLDGVRKAKALTSKPLVAIGGLSLHTIASVLNAGADSVAVIGALYRPGRSTLETAQELLQTAGKEPT